MLKRNLLYNWVIIRSCTKIFHRNPFIFSYWFSVGMIYHCVILRGIIHSIMIFLLSFSNSFLLSLWSCPKIHRFLYEFWNWPYLKKMMQPKI